MRRGRRALAAAALLAGAGLLACRSAGPAPEPYAAGDRLEPFVLEDPHGTERRVDESVRTLLFTRGMDADDLVDEVLSEAPEGLLAERDAVYVADISGMPDLVTRLFALPSLRERSYPMLLDRSGEATARLPAESAGITLVRLEALRVVGIWRLGSAQALRIALGLEPPPGEAPEGDDAATGRASPPET